MPTDYDDLTLCDLALSSVMYNSLTPYNSSLRSLRTETRNSIDLNDSNHCALLVKWLNAWGCRLPRSHHQTAVAAIQEWYEQAGTRLLPKAKTICDLDDHGLSGAAEAYGSLVDKKVARLNRGTKTSDVRMGPTAASKVLFVLCPEALMPWDEAMRTDFGCDGSPESYVRFLQRIKKIAWRIRDMCGDKGFDIVELPRQIGRPDSTVLELINEYIWITVTKKCELPSPSTLARWASW